MLNLRELAEENELVQLDVGWFGVRLGSSPKHHFRGSLKHHFDKAMVGRFP